MMLGTLWQLFWSFFNVGLFSIGGGYAALPLIQEQVVEQHGWLSMSEFVDVLTISQMTPGPIAINSATFVGTRIAGLPGAIIATIGCVTPSCIIVLFMAYLYKKYKNLPIVKSILSGLRPAVVALIATAGVGILLIALWGENPLRIAPDTVDWPSGAILLLCFLGIRRFKLNPIYAMLASGLLGGVIFYLVPTIF